MSLYIRCKDCGHSYISRNNNLSGSCRKCSRVDFDVILLKTTDSIYGKNSKTFPSSKIIEEYNTEQFKKIEKGKAAMYSMVGLDDEFLYVGQAGNIVDRINKWLLHGDGLNPQTWFIERDEIKEVYIFIAGEISEENFNDWKSKGYISGGLIPLNPPSSRKLSEVLEFAAIEWFNPVFNIDPGRRHDDVDINPIFFYEASYIRLKCAPVVSISQRLQNKLEFLKKVHEKRDRINPDYERLRIHYDGLSELFRRFSLASNAF